MRAFVQARPPHRRVKDMGIGVERARHRLPFSNSQQRRQCRVFNIDQLRGEAAGFERIADDRGDQLADVFDGIGREQRFVVTRRAGVVEAGNVGGC